eukprot:11328286-Heterocapsa_arctica.AAC.1
MPRGVERRAQSLQQGQLLVHVQHLPLRWEQKPFAAREASFPDIQRAAQHQHVTQLAKLVRSASVG